MEYIQWVLGQTAERGAEGLKKISVGHCAEGEEGQGDGAHQIRRRVGPWMLAPLALTPLYTLVPGPVGGEGRGDLNLSCIIIS